MKSHTPFSIRSTVLCIALAAISFPMAASSEDEETGSRRGCVAVELQDSNQDSIQDSQLAARQILQLNRCTVVTFAPEVARS